MKMRHESAVLVPLIARGRALGVLTLSRFEGARAIRSGRRRAGRRGRAARGAGARQRPALRRGRATRGPARGRRSGNLAEAVTVQRARRRARLRQPAAAARLIVERGPDRDRGRRRRSCAARSRCSTTRPPVPLDALDLPSRALAGEHAEPLLVRAPCAATDGEQSWWLLKCRAASRRPTADSRSPSTSSRTSPRQRRTERQQTFLAEASKLLASSLDLDVDLRADGRLGGRARARRLVLRRRRSTTAASCAAWRSSPTPTGRRPPARRAGARPCRWIPTIRASIAHLLRTGVPVLATDIDEAASEAWTRRASATRAHALEASRTRSALVVPMTAGDRIVGTITLGHDAQRSAAWWAPTWRWPRSSARRAGIAVENAARARRALAHRHDAAAQPAAAAPARHPGPDDRRALPRRRRRDRGRRRLLRPVPGRRRLDGRDRRRHRQGPRARPRSRRWRATRCAPPRCTRRRPAAVLRAPQRDARRRPRPPPDLHRGVRRGSSRPTTAPSASRSPAAATRRRCCAARSGAAQAGRPGSLLGAFDRGRLDRGRRRRSARASRSCSTPTASPTRAGADASASASERLDGRARRDARAWRPTRSPGASTRRCEAFERGQQRDDVALLVLRAGGGESSLVGAAANVRSVRDSRTGTG